MKLDQYGLEPLQPPEEDSTSEYEESSKNDGSNPSDDQVQVPPSRDGSHMPRTPAKKKQTKRSRAMATNGSEPEETSPHAPEDDDELDKKFRDDAQRWAATFVPPGSTDHIRTPSRRAYRSTVGKRKYADLNFAPDHFSQVRVKRFQSFYSNEYRKLFNSDIDNIATPSTKKTAAELVESQIGSSVWTAKEKELFFSALGRLGRDNVHAIALRIGTKSELEVQEYVHVLHDALKPRMTGEQSNKPLLQSMDFPAAAEINEECCVVLERAADCLSSLQECYEIEKEATKWSGDSWLVTQKLANTLEKQRRDPEEEAELEDSLPAANLFDLGNWLELSREVFMNSIANDGEDNWRAVAEPGELPAIRTTAIDDFYSLTLSVIRRLISTALLCTMSRRRARKLTHARKAAKNAYVILEDVEAAVKMLGLKKDSGKFWTKAARRCKLNIVDDGDERLEEDVTMTYDEVEAALASEDVEVDIIRPPSRSRSVQHDLATSLSETEVGHEDLTSALSGIEAEHSDSGSSLNSWQSIDFEGSEKECGATSASSGGKSIRKKRVTEKNHLRAEEEYTETLDIYSSCVEERKLWAMLRQEPPFNVQPPVVPGRPARTYNEGDGVALWREHTEYWSTWEMMPTPVPNAKFAANRKLKSSRARRKERLAEKPVTVENSELDETADDDDNPGDLKDTIGGRIESVERSDDHDMSEDGDDIDATQELNISQAISEEVSTLRFEPSQHEQMELPVRSAKDISASDEESKDIASENVVREVPDLQPYPASDGDESSFEYKLDFDYGYGFPSPAPQARSESP
ncbi:hypothetical protein BJ878DRAFT_1759 [Calycina marina]|uniref:SANT domain-containing protein n=1 Tax=Calycina marina TaxID=1763456 RepID=A0A9P8CJF7_9HELO|nr:hypothetical protein BJ878DRAFT_1759 [Calycina marina]